MNWSDHKDDVPKCLVFLRFKNISLSSHIWVKECLEIISKQATLQMKMLGFVDI